MTRRLFFAVGLAATVVVPRPLRAQGEDAPVPDSIAVQGNRRVSRESILLTSSLAPGRPVSYRVIQQAIQALFGTGQYEDVRIDLREVGDQEILIVRVVERPLLQRWNVRGVEHLAERTVRDAALLVDGRPLDPATIERARFRIDSLYRARGFALATVAVRRRYEADSATVTVVFEITEGRRVAVIGTGSTGVQIVRAAAILQLLLGNVGRPGGGIIALRGHASIQGSTDIPTLYNMLMSYMP